MSRRASKTERLRNRVPKQRVSHSSERREVHQVTRRGLGRSSLEETVAKSRVAGLDSRNAADRYTCADRREYPPLLASERQFRFSERHLRLLRRGGRRQFLVFRQRLSLRLDQSAFPGPRLWSVPAH